MPQPQPEPLDIGFLGGSYAGISKNVNATRSINLMAEGDPTDDKPIFMFGTPGLTLKTTIGNGPIRGMMRYGTDIAVVSGSDFRIWTPSTNTSVSRGTLTTSSGPVSMCHNGPFNGQQIMVADGGGYIYDSSTNAFAAIADGDFVGSDMCIAIDGYFLFNQPDTDYLQISNQYDGTVMFGRQRMEGSSDKIVGLIAVDRNAWVTGEDSSEVMYNEGDPDFPFQRFEGGFDDRGSIAPHSIGKVGDTVIWLGANERSHGCFVGATGGFKTQFISPPQINRRLQELGTLSDAIAYTYQEDGHEVYVCTFPTADWTVCFDASAPPGARWHERSSNLNNDGFRHRHRGNCHAQLAGVHYVGDYASGKIYIQDVDTYTEDGELIICERVGRHIRDNDQEFTIGEIQLVFEEGVGPLTGGNANAQIRWSKDGGHTWGNWVTRSFGREGNYRERAMIRKLGKGRDWLFWYRSATDSKRVLHQANAIPGSGRR